MTRWREIVADLAIGGIAGVVVLGIGGRIAMRVIARAAGLTPGFSLGGSSEVLFAGAWRGVVGGLFFATLRRFGPENRFARVLLLGGLLFAFSLATLPASLRSLATELDVVPLALALFGGLFGLYGATVEWKRGPSARFTNDSKTTGGEA